jgi:tripartite ATP-independent transporter DctP family solute receptor
MRVRCRWLGLMTAGLLGVCAAGCKQQSDVTVLKLAHALDVEHPVHKAMALLADRVAEKSGGTMRIDIYPSEQLGSERECIEQVQLGILDMTKTSSGPLEGFIPQIKVLGLPYLFRDSEHMWKVFNGEIGRKLLTTGESRGLRGLCYYDAGARSFYTVSKQIRTPADLPGLKIRVLQSEMSIRMILAMGGSATPIPWGELYTALQQGVVDGAENNPPSFYLSNHYEICKYYTLDEHLRLPDILVMNTKVWYSLTPEQQRILREALDESVAFQRELWAKKEAESLAAVEEAGVIVTHPDKEPFREAVRSLWEEFNGTEIGELAAAIQAVK